MDTFDLAKAKKTKPVGETTTSLAGMDVTNGWRQHFENSIDGLLPEKRLMLAVLEDSVVAFQRGFTSRDPVCKSNSDEARKWMESGELEWPFSFLNICEALCMDPNYVRAGLLNWSQQRATEGILRKPIRRVNGSRHKIMGKRPHKRRSRGKKVEVIEVADKGDEP